MTVCALAGFLLKYGDERSRARLYCVKSIMKLSWKLFKGA